MTAAPLPLGQLTTPELARLHLITGDWAIRFLFAALTAAHAAAAVCNDGSDEYRELQARRVSAMACAREVEQVCADTRAELAARRAVLKEVTRA